MPSPFGHSLMGLIIYRASGRLSSRRYGHSAVIHIIGANAADLDFIPGLWVGDLARFHHGPSHSIGFAVMFGILSSVFFSRRFHAFLSGFSVYVSHVLLDYLVRDPSPPHGVPLLWPFSRDYYIAPFAFFPRFEYLAKSTEPTLSAILSIHNVEAVATEILFLSFLLVLISVWGRNWGSKIG